MPAKPSPIPPDRFEPLREAIRLAALARAGQAAAYAGLEEAKLIHDRAVDYAHRAEQLVIGEIQECETAADRDLTDGAPPRKTP